MNRIVIAATIGAALAGASAPSVFAQENPLFQNELWWFGVPNPVPSPSVWVYDFTPLPIPSQIASTFAQIPQSCSVGDCTAFVQSTVRGAAPLLAPAGYPVDFMSTLAEAAVAGATIGLATSNNLDNFSQALADVVGAASIGTAEGLADAGVPADQATAITVQAVASSARSAMVSVAAEPNLSSDIKVQVLSQMVDKAIEVLGSVAPGAPAASINGAVAEISTGLVEAIFTAEINVTAFPELVSSLQSIAALSTDPAQQTAIVQIATDLASGRPIDQIVQLPPELRAASPS
jgi:hypothetical protein